MTRVFTVTTKGYVHPHYDVTAAVVQTRRGRAAANGARVVFGTTGMRRVILSNVIQTLSGQSFGEGRRRFSSAPSARFAVVERHCAKRTGNCT